MCRSKTPLVRKATGNGLINPRSLKKLTALSLVSAKLELEHGTKTCRLRSSIDWGLGSGVWGLGSGVWGLLPGLWDLWHGAEPGKFSAAYKWS